LRLLAPTSDVLLDLLTLREVTQGSFDQSLHRRASACLIIAMGQLLVQLV